MKFYKQPTKEENENDKEKKKEKAELFDTYLSLVEPHHISRYRDISELKNAKNVTLKKCWRNTDGTLVCANCGDTELIVIESEKANFKEQSQENSGYPYKRINHFNEWLSQIQGKN